MDVRHIYAGLVAAPSAPVRGGPGRKVLPFAQFRPDSV